MKSLIRLLCCRAGHGVGYLARTWLALMVVASLLIMIDLRVLWQQADSPASITHPQHVQGRLRDGYSHSITDVLRPPAQQHRRGGGSSGERWRSPSGPKEGPPDSSAPRLSLNIHDLLSDIGAEGGGSPGEGAKEGGGGRGTLADPVKVGRRREAEVGASGKVEEEEEVRAPSAELTRAVVKEADSLTRYVKALKLKPHSKWIVLDVTSGRCQQLQAAPSDWKILAVGEAASLKGCSAPSCVYLPALLHNGTSLKGGSSPETTSPIFQKNLAYLAAISHGAQFIMDAADCSTSLERAARVLQFPPRRDHGPMYNQSLLFNVYAHFGAWAAVPRALGDGGARARTTNARMYFLREFDGNVWVKHGVSDKSPDVARVDGRERAADEKGGGTRFDRSAPPVFVGQRSFSPAVPVVSVYRHPALWALLLPCRMPSRRCLVLRLLLEQRLFRDLDAFSGLYQLNAITTTTPPPSGHAEPSTDVDRLVSLLDAWKCRPRATFFDCLGALGDHLYEKRALSEEEYSPLKAWVRVLRQLRVAEPERVTSPWRGVRRTSEVRVTLGSMQGRLESGGAREEGVMRTRFVEHLAGKCNVSAKDDWFPVARWRTPVIEDIVLIVVFNWNVFFWNNLPFTETMHRPFFKHIFYCVPNVDELLVNDREGILRHVSFVEGLSDTWYFMYECVTIVAQMDIQGVRGYLQIGDDTLTNSWKYVTAPRDRLWIPHGFTTMRAEEASHSWNWYWWKKSRGRPAVLHAMADLERLSGLSPDQLLKLDPNHSKLKAQAKPVATFDQMYQSGKAAFPRMRPSLPGSESWESPSRQEAVTFLKNYYKANKLSGRVKHRALDFFYVPQVLADGWVTLTRHFLSHNVLIELAVPTIHYGLAPKSQVNYVSANSLWNNDRNSSYSFYDEFIYFLHPFKMKAHMEQKESRDFFCSDYMSLLFTELADLTKA